MPKIDLQELAIQEGNKICHDQLRNRRTQIMVSDTRKQEKYKYRFDDDIDTDDEPFFPWEGEQEEEDT